ncbi:MAG: hypothetical protein ABI886_08845 [Betaproteobacteria bacterium]
MHTNARPSGLALRYAAGLAAIAVAFAVGATMIVRSAAARVTPAVPAASAPADLKTLPGSAPAIAQAQRSSRDAALRVTTAGSAAIRKTARCAGCGVVESMRRIDRREISGAVCSGDDFDRLWLTGHADAGGYASVATLADTAEGLLAGRRDTKRMSVTSSHEIVVRFADGSRHVFNEATGRSLHPGERIQVIAGIAQPAQ